MCGTLPVSNHEGASHGPWPNLKQLCGADSVAAWLATGLSKPGDACTILGSTLAVKLLSAVRCEDAGTGAYSQRLGRFWLTGGAGGWVDDSSLSRRADSV